MGNDNPPSRHVRVSFAQSGGDIIVGKSVEPVSPDSGIVQVSGQREALGHSRLAMMERSVEACDLRQPGRHGGDGTDRREIVWLVQRRQRTQRLQLVQHGIIDKRCVSKSSPAMEHAMPDRERLFTAKMRPHPVYEKAEQGLVVRLVPARPGLFCDDPAVRIFGDQVRHRADALDLPIQQQRRFLFVLRGIARELYAGRPRVDDDNRALHGRHSLAEIVWRRACASNTATAADAIRARGVSARLVNMIGMRAPSTIPAAPASAR